MTLSCLSDQNLSALLAGELPSEDLPTIELHLTQCNSCCERLNRLSDSPMLAEWRTDKHRSANAFPYLLPSERSGDLGRIGRYFVEAELGRGGMGIVFRAWDSELRRAVALKVLRVGRDDERAAERFLRESRVASQVKHDHLVPVLDVVRTGDGRPVMVMPFIDGLSLRDHLLAEGALTPRDSATRIREVADGLAAIHAAGMIHRDVKPNNILLDRTDGRAKLTDFGLSRSLASGETLTQDGTIVGTPEYLSPEQTTGNRSVDPRSDVYSLGITLYECLTGVVPFRGSPMDVIAQHRSVEPVPMSQMLVSVPGDLDTICRKCLAKEPERRYSTAAEVRDDLNRWLSGQPILARPTGRVESGYRWCRRNPWPVALLLVSLVGFITSTLGWWRANQNSWLARNREEQALTASQVAIAKSKLADERTLLALGAINTLVTKSQNLIADTPGTLHLKKQLNEAALVDLRKLSEASANVPDAERSTILAHLKLGDSFNSLGQTEDALKHWSHVVAIAERRLADHPTDRLTIRDLASAHHHIGHTKNRLLDFSTASEHFDAAADILERAHQNNPDDLDILQSLAVAYSGRADVWWLTGNASRAVQGYERAVKLDEQYLDLEPTNTVIRSNLLFKQSRIGYVNIQLLHDYEAAESVFRKQLSIAAEQVKRLPSDRTWMRHHWITHLDLSSALQRQCRYAEAEMLARNVLEPLGKTAAGDPENVMAQRDHSMAWSHLSHAQLGLYRFNDAQKSAAKALAILESVATKRDQNAIIAGDLPPACLVLAHAAIRNRDYELTAASLAKLEKYYKQTLAASTTPVILATVTTKMQNYQQALKLFVAAAGKPIPFEGVPDDIAELATVFRSIHLAHEGNIDQADSELNVAHKRFLNKPQIHWAQATIDGQAHQSGRTTEERQRRLHSASRAILTAIASDRSFLDIIHLAPELSSIRKHPEFRKQLTAQLSRAFSASD